MKPCSVSYRVSQVRSKVSDTPKDRDRAANVEMLPFTIKRVRNGKDLSKAVQIRYAAYARHVPTLAQSLRAPETLDFDRDVVVLLAESKLDGSPLGTVRIQTNLHQRLTVEQSIELPAWLQNHQIAEVTRLGIDEGRIGRIVKIALIKACFQYCEQNNIEWALAAGRAPIDRQYEQLLFSDVFPEIGYVPLRHAGNLPHRVMAFEIKSGNARWAEAKHPLLNFFCHTHHPDIDIKDDDEGESEGDASMSGMLMSPTLPRRLTTIFPGMRAA